MQNLRKLLSNITAHWRKIMTYHFEDALVMALVIIAIAYFFYLM